MQHTYLATVREKHWTQLFAIEQTAMDSPVKTECYKKLLREPNVFARGIYIRTARGDKLVAFVVVADRMFGPQLDITSLCTDPEYQGRGFASRLVRWVLRQQDSGQRVRSTVRERNLPAQTFLRRRGFRCIKTHPRAVKINNVWEDVLLFERPGCEPPKDLDLNTKNRLTGKPVE